MLYEALEEKTAAAAPPVSGRIKTLPPSQLIITSVARFGAARPREIGFAMDSPLEGEGFELSVPRQRTLFETAPHSVLRSRAID
jgi:hypothetical protein